MGMTIKRICSEMSHLFITGMVIGSVLFFAVFRDAALSAEKNDGVPATSVSEAEGKRGVVAKVNGVNIMQTDLKAKMMQMLAVRTQAENSGDPHQIEALRQEALNKLIIQELAYQRAKAEGMTVGKDEIDGAVAEIREAKGGEKQYQEALKSKQLTEAELRKNLERNFLVKHIFEKEVAQRVVISEEEVRKEYDQTKDEFSKPEKVIVDDVVLFLALDDSNALKAAEELVKKINAAPGKDPGVLASDGTFVVREVELNKNKQKELYAEALKLKEGEVSGVIRTEDSFHIIKLKKYEAEVKADFAQIRGFLERRLRAQAQQKRMAEWEAEMKKDAKIEILDDGKGDQ